MDTSGHPLTLQSPLDVSSDTPNQIHTECSKKVTDFEGCVVHKRYKIFQSTYVPKQTLLRYGWWSCYFHTRCSMWLPCMSKHLPALRLTEVRTLSTVTRFTHTSRQAFSARCCNTSKLLIGSIYTKVFRCPPSQKSRGLRSKDLLGQLNELVETQSTEILVEVPPGNAGRIRLCSIVLEQHVLSFKNRYICNEYW
jgi:hypothetical protein